MSEIERLRRDNELLERKLQAALNRIDDDCETINRVTARNGALEAAMISQPIARA